jgi:hypothetical protein
VRLRSLVGRNPLPLLARPRRKTLFIYATAAVIYITISVFVTDFVLSVAIAICYLMLAAWLVPAAIDRLRLR